MHNNEGMESFDALFRDALVDAEVKAPRRVWRGVSSRIAPPAAKSRSWHIAAGVFAFAAAALALVFFLRTPSAQTPAAVQRERVALSGAALSQDNLLAYAKAASLTPAARIPKDRTIPQVSAETPQPQDVQRESAPSVEKLSTQSEPVVEEDGYLDWDEFRSDWSGKDSRGKRRIFVDAYGSAGGNDAYSSVSRPSYLSGYESTEGVDEQSVSVYGVPLSLGVGAKYYLNSSLSLSAGVEWSLLTRTFEGAYKTASGEFTHSLQYIGIPVAVSYDLVQGRTLKFYLSAGANFQKAVSSKYYLYSESSSPLYSEQADNLQIGVSGGFGVEFRLADKVSLYADPLLMWWIPSDQPRSIRTARPVMLNLEAGLRFRL